MTGRTGAIEQDIPVVNATPRQVLEPFYEAEGNYM